jgi:hypothetical protein
MGLGLVQANVATWATTNHYDTFLLRGLSALSSIDFLVSNHWYWLAVGAATGLAVGTWLDAFLKRQSIATPSNAIDRQALASEADNLAASISVLVSDYTSRLQIAWHEDSAGLRAAMADGNALMGNHARIQAQAIERYGEKYHRDVWRVIALAQKCIQLDRGDMWRISHGIRFEQVEQLPMVLTKIAAALRYPQPDLPMLDRLREQISTNPPAALPPSPAPPK